MNESSATHSAKSILDWADKLYAQSVDQQDAAGFAAAFTENGTLRFGNSPMLVGRAEIERAIAAFFTTFQSLLHESRGAIYADDTLVLEALVTYTRHDAAVVTLPAVSIFHLAKSSDSEAGGPLTDDCRIYVDLSPLYAP